MSADQGEIVANGVYMLTLVYASQPSMTFQIRQELIVDASIAVVRLNIMMHPSYTIADLLERPDLYSQVEKIVFGLCDMKPDEQNTKATVRRAYLTAPNPLLLTYIIHGQPQ